MGRIVGIVYSEEKPSFVCEECGKEFKSKSALNKHMQKEHENNAEQDQ